MRYSVRGWHAMLVQCARGLALGAASLFTLACAHAEPAAPAEPSAAASPALTVSGMRQTIELAPVHYAILELGASPEPVRNGGIPIMFVPAEENPTDLAGHAETQLLRFSLDHPDLRAIMTVTLGHYRVVARRSSGIETVADLRGKRIATMSATSAGYYLHRVLASAGLSEADVEIVSAPRPQNLSAGIIAGEVDALAIWEPESQRAIEALGEDAVILAPDVGYSEIYNLHTTAGHLADPETRAQVVEFVAAVIRATRALDRDPSPGIAMVSEATGYPEELLRASWPHHGFPAALAPNLLDILEDEDAWLAARDGRAARSREELARLIDPTVLAEAQALVAGE